MSEMFPGQDVFLATERSHAFRHCITTTLQIDGSIISAF